MTAIEKHEPIRCISCGRFIPYSAPCGGGARFHFEPANHFGPERSWWTCEKCTENEK